MIELLFEVSAAPDEGCAGCAEREDGEMCGLFKIHTCATEGRPAICADAHQRAAALRARHRRYADGIAGALREHRAYLVTDEPACSDANAIRALAQRCAVAEAQVASYQHTISEALNSDDGTYRP